MEGANMGRCLPRRPCMEKREALCRFCRRAFAPARSGSFYCSEKCRRAYQNLRRKEERAEARELREASAPLADPWAKSDLDDLSGEAIWQNALLDPLPPGMEPPWG